MDRRTLLGALTGVSVLILQISGVGQAQALLPRTQLRAHTFDIGYHAQLPARAQAVDVGGIQQSTSPSADLSAPTIASVPGSAWRIHVDDPYVRDGAEKILDGAATLLAHVRCEAVTSDFVDIDGQPLTAKLIQLRLNARDYLRLIVFKDGVGQGACKRDGILAYTGRGSRVVYLCGRTFLRIAQRQPEEARALIIHEMLHSLGLGENPPTSKEITYRVKQRCWH